MTPTEAISEIKAIVSELDANVINALDGALNNLYGDMMERIFNDKRDAFGNSLGEYSTKPTLIGAKSFRNKGNADKFFNSEEAFSDDTQGFRTLSSGKKAYLLLGGYKKLREMQGLQGGEIDLQYNSVLIKSIVPSVEGGKWVIEFLDDKNRDKGRGFEKRRAKQVFFASEAETERVFDYITENLFGNV
jgi:hypothetical protein